MKPEQEFHEKVSALSGEGFVVTGWALVYEAVAADGSRVIAAGTGDATGDFPLPSWTAEGMVQYALNNDLFGEQCDCDDCTCGEDDD